ncbi:MAG: PDDEXK nuclease domain-containing protein [Candidatus Competibacteraceae bacterium]
MSGNSSRTRRQPDFTFDRLLGAIEEIHHHLVTQATQAIHASLTLRNWLIGYQIENYRRVGADYFRYRDRLIDELATALRRYGLARCDRRELYRYRQFYLAYPRIAEVAAASWPSIQSVAKTTATVAAPTLLASHLTGKVLVGRLSFDHLAELMEIDPPRKRAFYERECLRGRWSARTLRRKIAGLYYELSDLAEDRPQNAEGVPADTDAEPRLTVRDPGILEFLGLKPREVIDKTDQEEQWLDALEAFLLDLDYGLCFETRQKHLLVGDAHCFIDLVFYHRLLKCHVLVEFQPAEFGHENITQLDACVAWYREGMMAEDDNPPVGILIHARQHRARVEYALAGLDRRLFVSRYQPALPGDRELQRFVEQTRTLFDST